MMEWTISGCHSSKIHLTNQLLPQDTKQEFGLVGSISSEELGACVVHEKNPPTIKVWKYTSPWQQISNLFHPVGCVCKESKENNVDGILLQINQFSPDALLVGLIMGPQVVHLALGDNTQVNVAARAQVIKDTCSDGIPHQLLGRLLLQKRHRIRVKNMVVCFVCNEWHVSGVLTSMSGL